MRHSRTYRDKNAGLCEPPKSLGQEKPGRRGGGAEKRAEDPVIDLNSLWKQKVDEAQASQALVVEGGDPGQALLKSELSSWSYKVAVPFIPSDAEDRPPCPYQLVVLSSRTHFINKTNSDYNLPDSYDDKQKQQMAEEFKLQGEFDSQYNFADADKTNGLLAEVENKHGVRRRSGGEKEAFSSLLIVNESPKFSGHSLLCPQFS